jgi:hypothetical protein
MSIGVGINEDVVLSKAEVLVDNDKISLGLSFREKGQVKQEADAFAQLAGDGAVDTGNGLGTVIRVWPPLSPLPTTTKNVAKTVAEMSKESQDNLGEVKNILIQILSCFTTTDKIKFSMFQGMEGITRENIDVKIVDKEVIKAAFTNLANQFVAQVTPFLDKDDCAVRLLLVRQSKEKHYAAFRNRFIIQNPIIELMAIPKDASKLKFTPYEIEKGLDKAGAVAKPEGVVSDAAPSSVANMFAEPAPIVTEAGTDAAAILNS